jgi:hypothetical protein
MPDVGTTCPVGYISIKSLGWKRELGIGLILRNLAMHSKETAGENRNWKRGSELRPNEISSYKA